MTHDDNEKALLKSFDEDERPLNRIELLKHEAYKKGFSDGQKEHTKTKDEVSRLVDLLELQIKICNCSAGSKYDMLDKIDNIHSTIHNMECEHIENKDDNIKVNVQYKLDKEAYRQYVADMKEIEAELKADSPVVGVAGEDLECGDAAYENSDGKMYKSDCIPATLKGVCEWWIKKYKRNSTFDEYTIMSNIVENMEYIMKSRGL